MEWYWIVALVLWAAGSPWGIWYMCTTPGSLYHHPLMDGFDIICWLVMFLLQLVVYMAVGWGFALNYGLRAFRTRTPSHALPQ